MPFLIFLALASIKLINVSVSLDIMGNKFKRKTNIVTSVTCNVRHTKAEGLVTSITLS